MRELRSQINWQMMQLMEQAARGDKQAQRKLELLGVIRDLIDEDEL